MIPSFGFNSFSRVAHVTQKNSLLTVDQFIIKGCHKMEEMSRARTGQELP